MASTFGGAAARVAAASRESIGPCGLARVRLLAGANRLRLLKCCAVKAVLFDLDGVLVKSEEAWFRTVEESGRRFRGRPVSREEFDPTFGQGTAADVEVFGLRCSTSELDAFYVEQF